MNNPAWPDFLRNYSSVGYVPVDRLYPCGNPTYKILEDEYLPNQYGTLLYFRF